MPIFADFGPGQLPVQAIKDMVVLVVVLMAFSVATASVATVHLLEHALLRFHVNDLLLWIPMRLHVLNLAES